jgi:hypothetical protein
MLFTQSELVEILIIFSNMVLLKNKQTPKQQQKLGSDRVAQAVESLPSKHKALSSNHSTTKRKMKLY